MTETDSARPRPPRTWWIVALAVVPMLGAAGWALLALSRQPENGNDRAAAASLLHVAPAVERALEAEAEHLARLGAVVARDPKFYAVLTLPSASSANAEFRGALEGVLRDFQREADAPVFAVTDPHGKLLGRALEPASDAVDVSDAPFVHEAVRGKQGKGYLVERERVYRVASVPISAGGVLVGTLTLGRSVDAELLRDLGTAMQADLTLTVDRDVAATTLVPSPLRKSLAERLSERTLPVAKGEAGTPVVSAGGRRYVALRRDLDGPVAGGTHVGYVLTRPLGSESSPLAVLERDLLHAAGVGGGLALVCGAMVALGVSRERRDRERARKAEAESWIERERRTRGLLRSVAKRVLDPAETVFTITDLVADGALGELSAPQREGILAIRRSSRGLTRMAQDLAALASLEAGEAGLAPGPIEVGNLVERAAMLAIPVASERRQMVELSVEPGLVHPALDESRFARAIEALALHVTESAPDATKIVLSAGRTSGCIEVRIAGAAPEHRGVTDAEAEELAPWLGRVVADLHGGSFEILTEEGIAYRILLPVPAHVDVVAATAPPSGGEGREDAVDPVPERAVPMESPDGPDSSEVAA